MLYKDKTKYPYFNVGKRIIGINYKPLVIPEIGINHNGSLETAIKIVNAAKRAGAEIIKHQTHIPDEEMSKEAKKIKPGNSKSNIYKIIKKCTLSEEDEFKLFKYVKKKSLIFLSTPYSKAAVDRLIKFGVSAFKIGSGEMNNIPLIKYISKFKKPMIISTGMHSIQNVKNLYKLNFLKKCKLSFLHTTNLYPTPNKLVRLGSITELMKNFPDVVIGLSDHTKTLHSSFGAVALGVSIIEKHFVDKKTRKGPDVPASIDEKELKDLIYGCNIIFEQRGLNKVVLREEQVTRNFAFASVVTTNQINKNEKFTEKNIWVKRPGNGEIKVNDFYKILGKKSKFDLKKNIQLKKRDIID